MTKCDFIKKAEEKHGNKYDYSITEYKNNRTKIKFICKKHGIVEQTPFTHIRTCGCPKCSKTYNPTTIEWIDKAKKIHKNKFDYSKVKYKNKYSKIIIICKIHGEFKQIPGTHLRTKSGCPQCAKNRQYNQDTFIKQCNLIHKNKFDYSITKFNKLSNFIYFICPIHGKIKQKADLHLRTNGCIKCSNCEKTTFNIFIEKSNLKHNNKYKYIEPKKFNIKDNIDILCPKHGLFIQKASNHMHGNGCQKCRLVKQMELFEKLKFYFEKEELLFETNENIKWLEKQRFDIYFPKYNIAIEYNGKQHYESVSLFKGKHTFEIQQKRDKLKRDKCKKNNCFLFEMKYNYTKEDFKQLVLNINNIIKNF